jgi:hypothetical protein
MADLVVCQGELRIPHESSRACTNEWRSRVKESPADTRQPGRCQGANYNAREIGRATLIVVVTTTPSIYHRANSHALRVRAMCIFRSVPSANRLDVRLRGRRADIHKLHACASKQGRHMRSLLMR